VFSLQLGVADPGVGRDGSPLGQGHRPRSEL